MMLKWIDFMDQILFEQIIWATVKRYMARTPQTSYFTNIRIAKKDISQNIFHLLFILFVRLPLEN